MGELSGIESVAVYGIGKYYGRGTMERVASYRGLQRGATTGFVTHPDCDNIGRTIYVNVYSLKAGGYWYGWEAKTIADCSQPEDYARHVRANQIEFSYEDAQKYGFVGEGRTEVKWYLP